MNIIFDLDGTLIDSSERMYRLFRKLVPDSKFTKSEYWELKRNKTNHEMIINSFFPEYNFEIFNKEWLEQIELPEYLSMDQVFPDTFDVLNKLYTSNNLILLTARQHKKELSEELKRTGLLPFFKCILVTEASISKRELLRNSENELFLRNSNDVFVSDMGSDILVGNELRYHTVAITHGFMNKDHLLEYKPDFIIDCLEGLIQIVEKIQ